MELYDVIVVGYGPAAKSAILYLSRFKRKVLVITGYEKNGKLDSTPTIENYLGFNGRDAIKLSTKMNYHIEKEAKDYENIDIVEDLVINYRLENKIHFIETIFGETFTGKTILFATGSKPKKLDSIKDVDNVHYCATCDGSFYEGKNVVVVGGGETALEEALFLSNISEKVYLIHRRKEFRASEILVDKVRKKDNIIIVLGEVASFNQENKEVLLKEHRTISDISGVFVAIGNNPNSSLFKEFTDSEGYFSRDLAPKGVYATGDVVSGLEKQIIIAAGDGATQAICINRFLG